MANACAHKIPRIAKFKGSQAFIASVWQCEFFHQIEPLLFAHENETKSKKKKRIFMPWQKEKLKLQEKKRSLFECMISSTYEIFCLMRFGFPSATELSEEKKKPASKPTKIVNKTAPKSV